MSRALAAYLNSGKRRADSPYVFTTKHGDRLIEAGIHHWFQKLKASASTDEQALIGSLSFHDLRQDFAYRASKRGATPEQIARYMGLTRQGTPTSVATAKGLSG